MILLVGALVILLFGFVVLFGAPYLPTRRQQTDVALELLDLRPGQTLLELGSGDGRVLRAAARQGIRCIGYELNPILVVVSWLMTWRYRQLVSIRLANYWRTDWPKADGIYTFLLDKYMTKLDKKISAEGRPVKLVSYAFKIPGKKSAKQKAGLFLYTYN